MRGRAERPCLLFYLSFCGRKWKDPGSKEPMNQRRFVNSMKKTIKVLAWIVSGVLFASSVMACGRQPEQPATEPVDKTTSKAPVTETMLRNE